MPFSPYLPHVIASVALTSISINLVSFRKTAEDEVARVNAQISILESIKQQLQSKESLPTNELERLRTLARRSAIDAAASSGSTEQVNWGDVFSGKAPSKDTELSKWEQKDLEDRAFLCQTIIVLPTDICVQFKRSCQSNGKHSQHLCPVVTCKVT